MTVNLNIKLNLRSKSLFSANFSFLVLIHSKQEQETMGVKLFSSKLIIHLEKFSYFWQELNNKHFHFMFCNSHVRSLLKIL